VVEARPSARARLLRAAAELTYDRGIEATGVDAIARAADVTKRTLYQHFRSKDELVGAALAAQDEATLDALRQAVERRIAGGAGPVDALFEVLAHIFAKPTFRGCAFVNAGLEMRAPDHPVRAVVRAHTDARREFVADLVRREGVVDEATIDAVALLAEGAFALSASRREPAMATRAATAARAVLAAAKSS
jgi:AcrR family transcriptional regulator